MRTDGDRRALVFRIDDQRYALPAEDVAEVLAAVTIARLPKAPAVVEGIIDLRGRLVPVLDLRARFRHPPRALDLSDRLVVARAAGRLVALRVDEAIGLEPMGQVRALDGLVPRAGYVAGVARLDDGLVLVHDLATFLTEAESEAIDRALAEEAR